MCAKQSLKQPVSAERLCKEFCPSLTPVNTIRSGYHSWRVVLRGAARSPVRNDAGRNALSGVKVSSPVKLNVPEWPSDYTEAKATSADQTVDTLGVQVHGMYRRLYQELGRSPSVFSLRRTHFMQDVMLKYKVIQRREVRWFRSSEEVE